MYGNYNNVKQATTVDNYSMLDSNFTSVKDVVEQTLDSPGQVDIQVCTTAEYLFNATNQDKPTKYNLIL